jgi:hypothetical protein
MDMKHDLGLHLSIIREVRNVTQRRAQESLESFSRRCVSRELAVTDILPQNAVLRHETSLLQWRQS